MLTFVMIMFIHIYDYIRTRYISYSRTCPTLVLPQGIIEFVEDGLKQCDVITSLDIDAMMSTLFARLDKLGEFEMSLGVNNTGYWILFTVCP